MSNILYRLVQGEKEAAKCCGCNTSGYWDGIRAVLGCTYEAKNELQDAVWACYDASKEECQKYIEERPDSFLYDLQVTYHLR